MAKERSIPLLPVPRTAPPRTPVGRWLRAGHRPGHEAQDQPTHPWWQVLWLTGVDYFSTLGYQPGLALLAAGAISPFATGILALVTLLAAVPVYSQVARRSYVGQGSIAMLESLVPGWGGKLTVLVLLGFAATDFVITMTLSAADAAQHAVENPLLRPLLGDARLVITLGLLGLLATVFLRGFREAIRVATFVAVPFLILNVVVLFRGVLEVMRRPGLVSAWNAELLAHGDMTGLLLASAIVFPRLALGLSGFETGVAVMPLIAGDAEDMRSPLPHGQIRATRRLLLTAAVIMTAMLVSSSIVTTILVPPSAYQAGGEASGRAIAYLAHYYLGPVFGSLYDLWTIAILWFAGASAMAGLLNLIPRYLPRFGMAPQWTSYHRPLVLLLFVVTVLVTLIFDADVEAQAGAYATGVLVLMLSASLAVALAFQREGHNARTRLTAAYFWIATGIFGFTLVDNVHGRPDGLIIASIFILAIVIAGAASRYRRATELRVSDIRFHDDQTRELWNRITGRKVHLVPIRTLYDHASKAAEIRHFYSVTGPMAFVHVALMDNRSEFLAPLVVRVRCSGEDYVIEVTGAIAIANTIAYMSELLDPLSIFLGLSGQNPMTQAVRYLLWGEGETGLLVYKILLRYWEWTEEEDVKPRIFIMGGDEILPGRIRQSRDPVHHGEGPQQDWQLPSQQMTEEGDPLP